MNRPLLLSLLIAMSTALSAAEVYDYTPDNFFSIKHTKAFRTTGYGLRTGFDFASGGKTLSCMALERTRLNDIFPDRYPFDAIWSTGALISRTFADANARGIFQTAGVSYSFGPYWKLEGWKWIRDARIFAGPSLEALAIMDYPKSDFTKPPQLTVLTGLRAGAELFFGQNISLLTGLQWSGGVLPDFPFILEPNGVDPVRKARWFQMFGWSVGVRVFLDE
jgi:hypothetical protein